MRLGPPIILLLRVMLAGWALTGCAPAAPAPSLLARASVHAVRGIQHPERITDDVAPTAGDHWRSEATAEFRVQGAQIDWDLGSVQRVRAAYLNADNNDRFLLEGSPDGEQYLELWKVPAVTGAGMRDRFLDDLDREVRFVRLRAVGGDKSISVGEVRLYGQKPETWPPRIPRYERPDPEGPVRGGLWAFGISAAAAVLCFGRRVPRAWPGAGKLVSPSAVAVVPASCLALVVHHAVEVWPLDTPTLDLLRAVGALIALSLVVRRALGPEGTEPRLLKALFAATALLLLAVFYNLGVPQFPDGHTPGSKTYVHTWDMRVYFPTAKYFDELGFDGLYDASVQAYVEDDPEARSRDLSQFEMRDLRDYSMAKISDRLDHIATVKQRFSPERWQQFKADMSWFRETMGLSYLRSLRDHGANATPVWLAATHLMFKHAPANETVLLWTACLDPLLFLLLFVAIARAFDSYTALACLVIFGATTVTFLGSNWAGSTLRHDWLVALGLGVCALKAGRPLLGGALLGTACMIRAFPAVAAAFIVVPFAWWLIDQARRRLRPQRDEVLGRGKAALRGAAGVVGISAALFLASSAVLPWQASWRPWLEKIALHSVQPSSNAISLRAILSHGPSPKGRPVEPGVNPWVASQKANFERRRVWYWALVAGLGALALFSARARRVDQASLLGLMLLPVVFYPSSYYLHSVFLLPMLAPEALKRQRPALWLTVHAVLLGFCLHNYTTIQMPSTAARFLLDSWSVLICYVAIWSAFLWRWPERVCQWVNLRLEPATEVPLCAANQG